MADDQNTGNDGNDTTVPTPKDVTAPHGAAAKEPERDWRAEYEKAVAQSRKWEERAKANKTAADKLRDMEEASKTDAEKLADATARAERAEAKVHEYEARAERSGIVSEVAQAKDVDREILDRMNGGDRAAIEANADWLKARLATIPKYPTVDDNGGKSTPVTKEQIEAIKDPTARVQARARHISLYKH